MLKQVIWWNVSEKGPLETKKNQKDMPILFEALAN